MTTVAPLRDTDELSHTEKQERADRLQILHQLRLPGTLPPSGTLGGRPCNDITIPVFGEWDERNGRWINTDHAAARACAQRAFIDFAQRLAMHTNMTYEISDEGRKQWWPLTES